MYTDLFIFLIAGFVFSVFAAYKSAYRGATHHWGVKLASSIKLPDSKRSNRYIVNSFHSINVHGLQNALTTRSERTKIYISVILNFGFLAAGIYFFNWQVAVVMLLGILIVKNLIRHLLPDADAEIYRTRIIRKLESEASYYKSMGMRKRKEKAEFFAKQLKEVV